MNPNTSGPTTTAPAAGEESDIKSSLEDTAEMPIMKPDPEDKIADIEIVQPTADVPDVDLLNGHPRNVPVLNEKGQVTTLENLEPGFVLRGKHRDFIVRRSIWGKHLIPYNDPTRLDLSLVEKTFYFNEETPKIPAILFTAILRLYFWAKAGGVGSKTEVAVVLMRSVDAPHDKWKVVVPTQKVSAGGVDAIYEDVLNAKGEVVETSKCMDIITGEMYESLSAIEGFTYAGTSHSHHTMGTYFSGIDDKNELNNPGLHIVVGSMPYEDTKFTCKVLSSITQCGTRYTYDDHSLFVESFENHKGEKLPPLQVEKLRKLVVSSSSVKSSEFGSMSGYSGYQSYQGGSGGHSSNTGFQPYKQGYYGPSTGGQTPYQKAIEADAKSRTDETYPKPTVDTAKSRSSKSWIQWTAHEASIRRAPNGLMVPNVPDVQEEVKTPASKNEIVWSPDKAPSPTGDDEYDPLENHMTTSSRPLSQAAPPPIPNTPTTSPEVTSALASIEVNDTLVEKYGAEKKHSLAQTTTTPGMETTSGEDSETTGPSEVASWKRYLKQSTRAASFRKLPPNARKQVASFRDLLATILDTDDAERIDWMEHVLEAVGYRFLTDAESEVIDSLREERSEQEAAQKGKKA